MRLYSDDQSKKLGGLVCSTRYSLEMHQGNVKWMLRCFISQAIQRFIQKLIQTNNKETINNICITDP